MLLYEPYDLKGKLALKNRIVMPPVVTRLATIGGEVTESSSIATSCTRQVAPPSSSQKPYPSPLRRVASFCA